MTKELDGMEVATCQGLPILLGYGLSCRGEVGKERREREVLSVLTLLSKICRQEKRGTSAEAQARGQIKSRQVVLGPTLVKCASS